MATPSRINVLFIASEAEPFVKVGGLADVAGSLPRALKALDHTSAADSCAIDIRLVIPFHPSIHSELYSPRMLLEYPVKERTGPVLFRAFSFEHNGLPVYLIGGNPIDQESGVYSANLEADGYKYVFFSLACLALSRQLGWQPDVLHANDWHTAAAIYWLAIHRKQDPFFCRTQSLLTVHNLPYLGSMTSSAMQLFGLPPADSSDLPSWARQMAMPLGLLSADKIVAVSPGYAREILTEEFGSGLDVFLKARGSKISGILNGLDTHKWDPGTDQSLAINFSTDGLQTREVNKRALQEKMDLEIDPRIPLLAMVTRMDPQKGVDIAVGALRTMLGAPGDDANQFQVILLGTGNPVLENDARQLQLNYPRVVRTRIQFDESLSHLIYAGADILLMPSRYEPCGLSQMIAMHYGCVPVARATGGLCDTIQDPQDNPQSTGFLFTPVKPEGLAAAIRRAITLYLRNPQEWRAMQQRGMHQDFSWARSAEEYLAQYQSLLSR